MADAVVFDFDGTLVDTIGSIWGEYQRAIASMKLKPITHREFTRHIGRAWDDIIRTFWPGIDPKEFTRHYRMSAERVETIPGAQEALKELRGRHELALMTSRGRTLYGHMKKAGLDAGVFKGVFDREMLRYNKPDPRALLQVCEELKFKPSRTIYVGDSVIDAQCANAAGTGFVAVLTGGAYVEDFRAEGVKDILKSVAELPALLKKRR
jgi:phosphoglycolate phosphatase